MKNIQLIKKQTFVVLVFFLPVIAFSQITEAWIARYNGTGNADDHAERIVMDAEGNLYVTGWSAGLGIGHDYSTVKYNRSGVQQWVAIYNGPGNANDVARSIKIDPSGNIYVTGGSVGSVTGFDFATVKYNAAGQQLWVARYDGAIHGDDQAIAIDVDPSGNIYVTGWSREEDHTSWATIKYNSSGVQEWVKKNNSGHPSSLVVDAFGNVIVTGISNSDYYTIKYSLSGDELWAKTYHGPYNGAGNAADEAIAMAVDVSGNVYVTGSSVGDELLTSGSTDSHDLKDYATIKYSSTGEELWVARYDGPASFFSSRDEPSSLAIDKFNNVYVTGSSQDATIFEKREYATIKYNSDGIQQWIATYSDNIYSSEFATALTLDVSGNIYVTGFSGEGNLYRDYVTIKYDPDGLEGWIKRYVGGVLDVAKSIITDPLGNVYVTGISGNFQTYDYVTIKYSNSCGNYEDKVFVCHNGHTICINTVDLQDHLDHGDLLGVCPEIPTNSNTVKSITSESQVLVPAELKISNYPNPFSKTTTIQYHLPFDGNVSIKVYDLMGRELARVINDYQKTGGYTIDFNAADLAKGIYLYSISLRSRQSHVTASGKMVIIR